MRITSSNPAFVPQTQSSPITNSGLQPAFRPAGDGFDGVTGQKVAPPPDIFAGRNDPPVFTGFDNSKLAAPLVLQPDGQPKSAKYTFAKLAQDSGAMPRTKAEAEQWFNTKIKPGMEAAGFQVDQVKGDSAFIHTRENPQGEWVDFLRGAGSDDKSYQALAWQSQGPGNAPAAGAASGASGATDASAMLQQLIQMLLKLMDPSVTDDQRKQGLQQILSTLQGTKAP